MILAKSLLEKTGLSIKEISIYIGIPDWNYFTKLFKKNPLHHHQQNTKKHYKGDTPLN